MKRNFIAFLGTAASIPSKKKFAPSILICGSKSCVLLDIGEGTQMRMDELGFNISRIEIIGISHLHGDHIYGLMPLIESMYMRICSQGEEKKRLKIVGPKHIRNIISSLPMRNSDGKENVDRCNIELEIVFASELLDNRLSIRSSSEDINIMPIPVNHGEVESYGYVVELFDIGKCRDTIRIFYTGDGICDNNCINMLRNTEINILVSEATFLDYYQDVKKAEETFHSTVYNAARIAKEFDVDLLVLTHISSRYTIATLRDFLSRAYRIFNKEILIAEDLSLIPLELYVCSK